MSMAKDDLQSNLNKYKKTLKKLGRDKLKPLEKELTIEELCAQGLKEMDAENSKTSTPLSKKESQVLETALGAMSTNPYVQARVKILNDLPPAKREQIQKMEETKNTDSKTYDEFVKMVVKLGDQLSDKKSWQLETHAIESFREVGKQMQSGAKRI